MTTDGPGAAGDAPRRSAGSPRWESFGRFCELFALSGVALAQPVLDSFSGSPETFVYRRATTFDIVVFALLVTAAVPAMLWAVEEVVGLVSRTARTVLHAVALAAGFALLGWQAVERHTDWLLVSHLLAAALAAVAGAGLVLLYAGPRTVLRLLAVVPAAVAVLWLGTGPVHEVAFAEGPGTAQGAPVERPAPIVMVVLDELPTASLLDDEGRVDETLFPGFARLADDSTWYRNTSAVSPTTPEAVPALLTGRYPGALDVPPTDASHPDNLFRAVEGTYDLNVWELVARLCPPARCPAQGGASQQGLGALLRDAAELWGDYMDEPPPSEEEAFKIRQSDPEAPRKFEEFIASLEATDDPRLDFIHLALPHQPWRHLPSGARHDAPFLAEGLVAPNYSWGTPELAEAGRQRHLLQLQRADGLLARMLQRLDDLDRYDDSLIVVVADHGVAFDAGEPIRGLSDGNAEQVMWVPFFVKEPGQSEGRIDDRPMETVDVFPTIVDIIGLDLPWELDGRAASAPARPRDAVRRFYAWRLNERQPEDGEDHVEIDGSAGFDELLAVPPAGSVPRDDLQLYRLGRWGPLVGEEVDALDVGAPADLAVALLDSNDAPVGPGHFDVADGDEVVPVYVRGDWEDGETFAPGEGPPVLVAVNGFVAGTGTWIEKQGSDRFFVLTPQELYATGENRVEVFTVTGTPADPELHPVEIRWNGA